MKHVTFSFCVTPPPPPPGKLTAYDTDGDGDFDVEDAKVLLGKSSLVLLSACSMSERSAGVVSQSGVRITEAAGDEAQVEAC